MIPTRDRVQDLEVTCAKLMELQPSPDEVIIFADGCRDATASMLRSHFPKFRLIETPRPMGSVYARDHMLRAARGDIVLSLDDDSFPVEPDFLEKVRGAFVQHPEAAVVAFFEQRERNIDTTPDCAGRGLGRYVPAYTNCAAAMRRVFYLQQPGFPTFFEHMYEEPDYSLQCYAGGKAVWFEPLLVVHHCESPAHRDLVRRHHLNARNELWSVWLRCPWPWLPLVSLYRVARQLVYALGQGPQWAVQEPIWWQMALWGARDCWKARRPVRWPICQRWLTLARKRINSVEDLRKEFPVCL